MTAVGNKQNLHQSKRPWLTHDDNAVMRDTDAVMRNTKDANHMASSMRNAGEVVVDIFEASPFGYLLLTMQKACEPEAPAWENDVSRQAFDAMGESMKHGVSGAIGGVLGWVVFYPVHAVVAVGAGLKDSADAIGHAVAAGIEALR